MRWQIFPEQVCVPLLNDQERVSQLQGPRQLPPEGCCITRASCVEYRVSADDDTWPDMFKQCDISDNAVANDRDTIREVMIARVRQAGTCSKYIAAACTQLPDELGQPMMGLIRLGPGTQNAPSNFYKGIALMARAAIN